MVIFRWHAVCALLLGTGCCTHGAVYAAPDAGSLLPSAPREWPAPRPSPRLQQPEAPQTPESGSTTPVVHIIGFVLEGEKIISDAAFSAAVAPFISRPINYADLRAAAQAVAWAYRQAGWVVDATLPEQDVSDGIVRIAVRHAVFGGIAVTGAPASDSRVRSVARYVTAQQAPGQPVRVEHLDRTLLLVNDLPGVSATGALREGRQAGETDFVVNLAPSVSQYGDVSFDNSGTRPAGHLRVLGNWNRSGLLRWGDQLSLNLIHSFTEYQTYGSDYQRLAYSLPLGYEGWRLTLGGNLFSYRLVSSEYSGLGFAGDSDAWDVELSYPMLRNEDHSLYLVGKGEHTHIDNEGAWVTVSRYRVESRSIGLRGTAFDAL